MKEQLISFNTATLAKEKKFNVACAFWYDGEYKHPQPAGHGFGFTHTNKHFEETGFYRRIPFSCTAPTQSLLQKWLRKKHNLIVWVAPVIKELPEYEGYTQYKFIYFILNVNTGELESGARKGCTFEDTFELGLIEALNLINCD